MSLFTVLLQKHADIWEELLHLYYPNGAKIIDFTYGTGALHWNIFDRNLIQYQITKCDSVIDDKIPDTDIHQKNINIDDYTELGLHDCGLFDPPYLIGRTSFDYPLNYDPDKPMMVVPQQMQGKRSWGRNKLKKHVANQSLEEFNERARQLNIKAIQAIKEKGLLFVKVMDPRKDGFLIPHHINITNLLTNFALIDHAIYIRQGATTWTVKGHLQNLHGHWMVFQRK